MGRSRGCGRNKGIYGHGVLTGLWPEPADLAFVHYRRKWDRCMRVLGMIFTLSVFVVACAKKKDSNALNAGPLPSVTQTGANVLGCYLDTTPYILRNDPSVFDFGAGVGNDTFFICGCPAPIATYWQALHFLELEVYHGMQVGVPYAATDNNHVRVEYDVDSACYYVGYDDIDVTACGGSVTLTKFDQTNGIVSGLFEVEFAIPGCDTVRLTDGRFDFSY